MRSGRGTLAAGEAVVASGAAPGAGPQVDASGPGPGAGVQVDASGPGPGAGVAAGADEARVAELLGRRPQGRFEVVVRDVDGDPVVIRNAPFLADGTPMPTRYWLVGAVVRRQVDQLEAAGGVRAAEAGVDPEALADAHRRYAAERDADIPASWAGARPAGGVGGTRRGVKCLHAHYAWYLAGGDDPVGAWVAGRLSGQGAAPAAAGQQA